MRNKVRKILLINPPYTRWRNERKWVTPPLGLAHIAAVLEKKYEVKIIDAVIEGYESEIRVGEKIRYGLSFAAIKERIEEFSPDIVGVSCSFSALSRNAHEILRIAKEVDRSIITIMGGAHPSAVPEVVMRDENLDFVVIGEGEETILKLVEEIENEEGFSNLDGIGYREEGEVKIIPKTTYIENLDDLPFPARHLLQMEKYFRIKKGHVTPKNTPYTTMITSRGCPSRCIFCSIHTVWGKKFRARSPENVLKEIEYLVEKYEIKEIHFEDDNLTFDKERAEKIFDGMVERNLDILWATPNGIALWRLDENLLTKMAKSGCYSLSLAIESGDEEVLQKIIKKPLKIENVTELVKVIKKLKIKSQGFFVIGLPGETKYQIKKTIDFANSLDIDDARFFIATPYPGTELYSICKEKGYLVKDPIDFEDMIVMKGNIETPEFSPRKLEEMQEEAVREFLYRKFKRNPASLLRYLAGQIRFIIRKPKGLFLGINRWIKFLRTHS